MQTRYSSLLPTVLSYFIWKILWGDFIQYLHSLICEFHARVLPLYIKWKTCTGVNVHIYTQHLNIVQHEEPKVSWMESDSTGSMLYGPDHWAPAEINMLRGLCCLFIYIQIIPLYTIVCFSPNAKKISNLDSESNPSYWTVVDKVLGPKTNFMKIKYLKYLSLHWPILIPLKQQFFPLLLKDPSFMSPYPALRLFSWHKTNSWEFLCKVAEDPNPIPTSLNWLISVICVLVQNSHMFIHVQSTSFIGSLPSFLCFIRKYKIIKEVLLLIYVKYITYSICNPR